MAYPGSFGQPITDVDRTFYIRPQDFRPAADGNTTSYHSFPHQDAVIPESMCPSILVPVSYAMNTLNTVS